MKRVAVLRGGPSSEYSVSMETGREVLRAIENLGFAYKDVVITKQGEWLDAGFIKKPEHALEAVDLVFVALHGNYGEDGQVQRELEKRQIPFVGSRSLPSAIAFNKDLTKQVLRSHNILTPRHHRLTREEYISMDLDEEIPHLFSEIGPELFVKPMSGGSSIGARYIPHEAALEVALKQLFAEYDKVIIEEFIRGREATVGVLGDFRNEKLYALPTIEITPPGGKPLFTYEDKYNGQTDEVIPGRFSYPEKSKLSDAARFVHETIGCKQYSRSDFIVRDGEVYFLEINTLPGLSNKSLYPKAAAAIGINFPQLIEHLVNTA